MSRFLLSCSLPDTTAIRLSHCNTAKERWDKVHEEFTAKSVDAQNNLLHKFSEMRCAKGTYVRTFPTGLTYKQEELAAAGITVSAKDYERTVLRGIPEELAKFAAHLLSSARLVHKVESIDTDTLISHICEEADRMKNRRTQDQQNRGAKRTARRMKH